MKIKLLLVAILFAMASVAFSQWVPVVEKDVVFSRTFVLDSVSAGNTLDSVYIKMPTQSFLCDSVAYILEVSDVLEKTLVSTSFGKLVNSDTAAARGWTRLDSVAKYNSTGRDSIGAIFKVQFHTPEHNSDSTTYWTWPTVLTKAPNGNTYVTWGANVKSSFVWPKIYGYIQGWVYNASGHRKRTVVVTLTQMKLTWRKV